MWTRPLFRAVYVWRPQRGLITYGEVREEVLQKRLIRAIAAVQKSLTNRTEDAKVMKV